MSLAELKKELKGFSSPERKKTNEWFFKTGKGQYGYGDKFIGVRVPDCRKIAKKFRELSMIEIKKLLSSPIHEERLTALLILVDLFEKGDDKKQKEIFDFYLENYKRVNNWDLVDLSAPKIVGAYLLNNPKLTSVLNKYAKSKNLWERRLSIVATFTLIRANQFDQTMKSAKVLLSDDHDLTHKAVGWMLREVWKRDHNIVEKFLKDNYNKIPRTTLRYAIERMPEPKRLQFLKNKF